MTEEQQSSAEKNVVTIEQAGPCKKKVIVEIPAETIKDVTDGKYESLRKETVVPGFRKGRAPRRLLEKRFGKETSEQIKLKLLSDASESALKENELDVLGEPDIDFEKIELPVDGPLKFDFDIEVRPQFELPELEGIPVEKRKLEVGDEQVEREIEQMRRYAGLWSPKDGAAQADDQIVADVVLKTEGLEEAEKLDGVEIIVRPNGFVGAVPVEKLDELLAGAVSGEVKNTSIDVAKTYFREEYRGKKVDISITIKEVKFLKPAEMSADFLKRFAVDSVDELRERMRDQLQSRLEEQVRSEMAEQIGKYMRDGTDFELPLDVVGDQAETLFQRQYVSLLRQGLGREQVEEQAEQLRSASEERAREQLKTFFIMDKVAEKLEIEVTDEEVNGHIARLAIQQGQRPERMREQMVREGLLGQFRLQLREDKCVARLLESARVTEAKRVETAKTAKKTVKKAAKKAAKKTTVKEPGTTASPKKKRSKTAKTPTKKKTDE